MAMRSKLLITKFMYHGKQNTISVYFEDDKAYDIEVHTDTLVSGIYIGKVKNIVQNLNAAFVEIKNRNEDRILCYYDLKENTHHIYLNHRNIENNQRRLVEGDDILVQVKKDGIKTKAPVVTSKIKVSHLEELIEKARYKTSPCLIRDAEHTYIDTVNRIAQRTEEAEIITDIEEVYHSLSEYMYGNSYLSNISLRRYEDSMIALYKLYNLEAILEEALSKKVWLRSGGYLVIEYTEALSIIDVNTGKTQKGHSLEDTVRITNMEAAKEIMRQLRLRNLAGIILIDFINMKDSAQKEQLLALLEEESKKDILKTKIYGFTKLQIIEMTREVKKKPLKAFF